MGTDRGTGWELDKREHFDEIVAHYDNIRPGYPDELFADLFAYAGAGPAGKALEIGAGTGKATAPVLRAGYDVTAVEIGANMADFLRHKFGAQDRFSVVVSSFEDAPLENSYDLIYAATAFHWVDAAIGCPKAFGLLKSGGVFALLRYNAVPADGDPLYEDIQAVYKEYYYRDKPYRRPESKTDEQYWLPAEIRRGFGFEDMQAYGFADVAMNLYRTARVFSAEEHIALLQTFSDHRSLPQSDQTALYAGVKEAIEKHGGQLKTEYVYQLYMGRKP